MPPLPSLVELVQSRFDADALVALNDALEVTPEARLRDVLRSVCLSNLDVAVVLHGALCRVDADAEGLQGAGVGGGNVKDEYAAEDDDDNDNDDEGKRPLGIERWPGDGDTDHVDDDDEVDEDGEPKRKQFAPGLYGTEYSPRDSDGNIPFDDWDIYEYNHQLSENADHEDEDNEDDESDEDDRQQSNRQHEASVNLDNGTNVPVLDLTDPDADKENTTAGGNRVFNITAQTNIHGQKRKASDDDIEFLYSKRAKRDSIPISATSTDAYPTPTNMERFKQCTNCSKQFDVLAPPCHDHKTGPRRTPGHRDRVCGEGYIGGDSTGEEDEPNEHCDCIYHSGRLRDHNENSSWIGGDEGPPVIGNMDWWRSGSPDDQVWDCCDQAAFAEGCKMSRHKVRGDLPQFAFLDRPTQMVR